MRLISTSIKNIGPHQNTHIEYENPINAICGANGTGKTFLLESVPAVLYGEFPSRPGSIADHITLGYLGDASISIKFELNGGIYIAERKLRKKPKTTDHEAIISCNGTHIAGPKVLEFEEAVNNLLGDSKLFFASAFSSQINKGDIVEAKPTERKKILSTMFSLEKYQEKSDMFGEKFKVVKTKIDTFDNNLVMLENMRKEVLDADAIKEIEWKIRHGEASIKDLTHKKELLQKQATEKEQEIKKVSEQSLRKKQLIDEQNRIVKEMDNCDIYIKSLRALSAEIPSIEKHQANRNAIIKINEGVADKNKIISATREQHRELDSEINSLSMQEGSKRRSYQERKESLEARAKLLAEGEYEYEQCKTCKFTADAIKAKEELEALPVEPDVSELQNKIKIAQEKKDKIILSPELRYQALPEDKSSRLADAKVADENIKNTTEKAVELTNKSIELCNEIDSIEVLNVDYIQTEIDEITEQIEEIDNKVTWVNSDIRAFELKKNTDEANVTHNKETEDKIAKLKEDNKQDVLDGKRYEYLQKAFSRNGIVALIIDNAIPSMQNIADELLQVATDGRMQIQFSTQKKLKSGKTSESLEIICTDEKGERDVSCFSGGEQRILRTVIRLTLAIYKTMSCGEQVIKTLFLDEIFDALDADNSVNLLNMISKTEEYFDKVIFISHNDDLLSDFENKIMLSKNSGNVEVL